VDNNCRKSYTDFSLYWTLNSLPSEQKAAPYSADRDTLTKLMIRSHLHLNYYHNHHYLLFSVAVSQLLKLFIPQHNHKSIIKTLLSSSIPSEFQSINDYLLILVPLSIPYWHQRIKKKYIKPKLARKGTQNGQKERNNHLSVSYQPYELEISRRKSCSRSTDEAVVWTIPGFELP